MLPRAVVFRFPGQHCRTFQTAPVGLPGHLWSCAARRRVRDAALLCYQPVL